MQLCAGRLDANLTLRQLMQQSLARLAARMCFENLAAQLAKALKPWPEIFRQLLVDLAAQMLRDRRAFSGSGNSNLQGRRD